MIKICPVCKQEFETDKPQRKLCENEECIRKRKKIYNTRYNLNNYNPKKHKKKEKKKNKHQLDATLKALNEYNALNGTKLSYGQYQEMLYRERRT